MDTLIVAYCLGHPVCVNRPIRPVIDSANACGDWTDLFREPVNDRYHLLAIAAAGIKCPLHCRTADGRHCRAQHDA